MNKNRKIRAIIIALAVIVGVLIPLTAFAADATSASDEAVMALQNFVNMAFGLVHAIFWPILLLIGSLMDNDLIFGPDIGERLRKIWVIMRNIVNIAFVFVLLIAAFYNVTGLGKEGNFALKSILPKFVIALIAVNFSFLACKVILDASNVVATAVYDMAEVATTPANMKAEAQTEMCTNTAYLQCMGSEQKDTGSAEAAAAAATAKTNCEKNNEKTWNYEDAPAMQKLFCCETKDLKNQIDTTTGKTTLADTACTNYQELQADGSYKPINLVTAYGERSAATSGTVYPVFNSFGSDFFKKVDQNNIGIVMAINLGGINKLTNTAKVSGLNLKKLTMNEIFGIVMYLVFGFAYVALFCVLMARLVVLWLVIALSPIIALTTVLPQVGQYASELKLGEKFIQHLIAPIVIGLSMTIGYVLIDAMKDSGAGGISFGAGGEISYPEIASGDSTGALLSSNISDIHQLMLACLAVAIVWMGVFGAADKTLANTVTNKIKEAGTTAATFVASLPKYAPIMPMMTGSKGMVPYSFSDISGILNAIKSAPAQRSSSKVSEWAKETGLNKWIYPDTSEAFTKMLDEYKKTLNKKDKGAKLQALMESGELNSGTYKQLYDELLKTKPAFKDKKELANWGQFKEWVATGAGKKELKEAHGGYSFDKVKLAPEKETPSGDTTTPPTGDNKPDPTKVAFTNIFQGADGKQTTQTTEQKIATAKPLAIDNSPNNTDLEMLVAHLEKEANKNDLKDDKIVVENGKINVAKTIEKIQVLKDAKAKEAAEAKAKADAAPAAKPPAGGAAPT